MEGGADVKASQGLFHRGGIRGKVRDRGQEIPGGGIMSSLVVMFRKLNEKLFDSVSKTSLQDLSEM